MRFLLGNFRLKFVAVALAIAFWSVVAYTSNPTNTSVFYVGLDRPRLPPGLVVLGTIPPVRVTVTASNDVLHGFNAGTLRATGDFSKVKVGHNLVPVQVTSTDPAVNNNLQYDPRIAAEVDQLASANEPVV